MLIGCGISIVAAILLVQVIGCDEKPQEEAVAGSQTAGQKETASVPQAADCEIKVYAPLNGTAKTLQEVNDPTFSEGILGQGAAIIPSEGKLFAPFDATVSSVFDTRHAICLEHEAGAEMLIHIGLETVSLGGKYFTARVKDGDRVKKGDLLIEFDLNGIREQYDTITPVLITNTDDFSSIEALKTAGAVTAGEAFLNVRK